MSDDNFLKRGQRRVRRETLEKIARTRAEAQQVLEGAKRLVGVPGHLVRAPQRLVERRSHTLGLPPGTLTAAPDAPPAAPAHLEVMHYTDTTLDERTDVSVEEARLLADRPGVTWINMDGVHDVATLAALGEAFGLHPLVQEDLAHTTQRPKLEIYEDQLFVVLRMVLPGEGDPVATYCAGASDHRIEQLAFVLGPGYVLSFQEEPGDVFEPVRERLRHSAGAVREQDPDYLLYALLDVVIDHYFITLERIGDATEAFEELVFEDPSRELQEALNHVRREVVVLRRAIWPLREVLTGLMREETPGISDHTRVYLRDAYDHLVQAVEIIESLREVLSSLTDLYLSAVSHKMNEVMKVLTVVGTLFIPLSFLTGMYGMNFEYIPELQYRYGYFVLLGVMALVTVGTLYYFRRKGWI